MLGYKPVASLQDEQIEDEDIPTWREGWDWREHGAVTPVQEQNCGDCWTFSSTGALSGAYFLQSGDLLEFSQQQLVDCVNLVPFTGCVTGGTQETAFSYYAGEERFTLHHPYTEDAYPYEGVALACKDDQVGAEELVTVSGYEIVKRYSANALKEAIAKQPVAVNIDASSFSFNHYSSGVYDGNCGQ